MKKKNEDENYSVKASKRALQKRNDEAESVLTGIKLSLIFLVPLLYISLFHALGAPLPEILDEKTNPLGFMGLQVVLCIPVLLINRRIYIEGFKSLFRLHPNIDTLIAIGSAAAFIYSLISCITPFRMYFDGFYIDAAVDSTNLYFDTASMIVTITSIGKYLEAKASEQSDAAAESLIKPDPESACVRRGGKETVISVKDIVVGDTVVIKAGERIPADGVMIDGFGCLDESAITGGSISVDKKPGDQIISSSVNTEGCFTFKATTAGKNTTLSKISALVEEAAASKTPVNRHADRVSFVFVPAVIFLAIAVVIIWIISGYPVSVGINFGISVLIISCPCAIGLATPAAFMVNKGVAAKNHILYKNAKIIEKLSTIDTVILDKTGTITSDEPGVTKLVVYTPEGGRVFNADSYIDKDVCHSAISIAAGLEVNSSNRIAKAITEFADASRVLPADSDSFETFEDLGVSAVIDGIRYYCGNAALAQKILGNRFDEVYDNVHNGQSQIYIFNSMLLIAKFIIKNTIKPESPQAIKKLKDLGLETVMLTGDSKETADETASLCGIEKVYSEILPEGKVKLIRSLKKTDGNDENVIAMIGDGINDSPALKSADVGIALASGTEIAIESADVVLTRSSIQDAVTAIRLSKRTTLTIKLGLFWALFYNCISIPIAAGAFYPMFNIRLTPMIGASCILLSSICVILNSLSIRAFKCKQ